MLSGLLYRSGSLRKQSTTCDAATKSERFFFRGYSRLLQQEDGNLGILFGFEHSLNLAGVGQHLEFLGCDQVQRPQPTCCVGVAALVLR